MEDGTKFRQLLIEPFPGSDYENVSAEVIEEELSAFMALSAETRR